MSSAVLEKPRQGPPDVLPPDDGNGGGGGGGGGDPIPPRPGDAFPITMSRLATLFVLVMVVMLFAGFLSGFIILEKGAGSWPPPGFPGLPLGFWISTPVILASSITGWLASRALKKKQRQAMLGLIAATFGLGVVFCAVQTHAWRELWNLGITPRSGAYPSNFYTLTVAHAIHVFGGMVYLALCFARATSEGLSKQLRESWGNCMLYWHFVGIVWYVLFWVLQ